MKLNLAALKNKAFFEDRGIELPRFDIDAVRKQNESTPRWVHVGPGNLFRGYIATLSQALMNEEQEGAGIIMMETRMPTEMDSVMRPHDLLSMQVVMPANGENRYQVTASMSAAYCCAEVEEVKALEAIFENPSLQILSFTVTEKGYSITGMDGSLAPAFVSDLEQGPTWPLKNTMSIVAYFLYKRYKAGKAPLTLLSLDNFSHNGDKLKDSVLTAVKGWLERGSVDKDFLSYVESALTFPISVIDRITPRPGANVADALEKLGFEDLGLVAIPNGPTFAPYVNTEPAQYLVIEDRFANGRPALEKVGVFFTDRQTADRFERMKVCTCLNPLHTALAVGGCVLGHSSIADEMQDTGLKALAQGVATEGLPVVVDPGILKPADFLKEVLEERFPNPYLPDTPQRIATDTSQKLAIRFGETIKAYKEKGLDLESLKAIPVTVALWCRYLLAVNDEGVPFTCSPDPLLEELQALLSKVAWNDPKSAEGVLDAILSNPQIFGLDLTQTPLAAIIESYFLAMLSGKGAVRTLLTKLF